MLACKLIPMLRCKLSETEKLHKAGMCLDFADGGHYAMACIISPIMQHAQSDSELIYNAGCQPSCYSIGNLTPTSRAIILGQHLGLVSHFRNCDRKQNGFASRTRHHARRKVICCSISSHGLCCALLVANAKHFAEGEEDLCQSARVNNRATRARRFKPFSSKFRDRVAIAKCRR